MPWTTEFLRGQIICLVNQGYSNREVADELGISKTTVARWRKRFEEEGEAGMSTRMKNSGRRRKTSEETDRAMKEVGYLFRSNIELGGRY